MESKFGKIVLVVIGVVLMITFLLPAGMQQFAGQVGDVGSLDGKKVEQGHLRQSVGLMEAASNIRFDGVPLPVAAFASPDLQRINQMAPFMDPLQVQQLQAATVQQAARRVDRLVEDPVTLFLLLQEANELGGVPLADVEEAIRENGVVTMASQDGTGTPQQVQFSRIAGADLRLTYLRAAKAAYDIALASRRHGDVVKLSRPFAERNVAAEQQEVTFRATPVAYDEFVATQPDPSAEAIEAHFATFRDEVPGLVSANNPFGFGYRQPDRVALTYIMVPRVNARQKVLGELSAQTIAARELEFFRYFKENRAFFPPPTTQPSTRPTTRPTDAMSPLLKEESPGVAEFLDKQAAGYVEAGRSEDADEWNDFVAVHDDVVEQLVAERTRSLLENAAAKVRSRLVSAGPEPDLQNVADQVEREVGVASTVLDLSDDLLAISDLAQPGLVGPIAEAGIGNAIFAQYVAAFTLPLLEGARQEEAASSNQAIDVNRPAPIIANRNGDRFVFRLTAAERAAPAENVNDVADEVIADLKRMSAMEQAESQAAEVLAAGLGDAVVVGPLTLNQGLNEDLADSLGLPELDAAARRDLAVGLVRLMSQEEQRGTIALPTIGVAVAAELDAVSPLYTDSAQQSGLVANARDRAANAAARNAALIEDYFDPESVAARTGFEPRR